MKRHSLTMLVLMLGVAVAMTGCKSKKDAITITPDTGSGMESTTGTGQPDLDQRSLLFGPSGLQTVYFDFDSSALRNDARATLKDNADKIKAIPGFIIQIEGHCDERGTQEYNLALGERRALAVRQYLIDLGVSGDRLVTISYGEEWPAVQGSNEAAWAQNRRAQFNEARR